MWSLMLVICLLTALSSVGSGQQAAQPNTKAAAIRAKHDLAAAAHVAPVGEFEQFAPYWTAEAGWHTDLQLRNNLASESLTVRPSLRTSDGAETDLKLVTLLPGEVRSVNLMDALMEVNSSLAGSANAYGSIALRYTAKSVGNLYGSVMVHDNGTRSCITSMPSIRRRSTSPGAERESGGSLRKAPGTISYSQTKRIIL